MMQVQNRKWNDFDWKKVGVIIGIGCAIIALPVLLSLLLPKVYCVAERNGELVKAYDAECVGNPTALKLKQ